MLALAAVCASAIVFSSWLVIAEASEPGRVRFYPDQTSVRPGEAIVWTIEVVDESILPLTVRPEFDNDKYREPSVRVDTESIRIEYVYETANFYMPYIEVDNYRGYQEKVYSDDFVSVIPDLQKRVGVGLSLPTTANPTGDYIKAMNIGSFNYDLFDSDSGEHFVEGELDRIAALGCNMVIFNDFWFHDQEASSVHEPIYGDPWPACWTGTLAVDALVKLVDWAHERGMAFCYRYMLRQKGDHSGAARLDYAPSDRERYISTQIQQKTAHARLFETLGVELFCLEAENEYFTRMNEVTDLIEAVRAVYAGRLTNGAYSVQSNLACPYVDQLDLLSWSDYYFLANPPSENDTAGQLTASYLHHYSSDIQFVLGHLGMIGMPIEVGVENEGVEASTVELQYLGYLDAFEVLQSAGAPICGIGWWAWTLFRPQLPNYVVSGHPAEGALRDYFKNTLSDTIALRFEQDGLRCPEVDQLLEAFETGLPRLETWWQGSRISTDLVGGSPLNDTCLRFTLEPEGSPDYRLGFIWSPFDRPMDWSAFTSFSFWLKSANDNWGVEVAILDADGDLVKFRFQTWPSELNSTLESGGWRFISIPLSLFTNPPSDGRGNESMDWRGVERWGLGVFYKDHGTQTLWLDHLYLSREEAY